MPEAGKIFYCIEYKAIKYNENDIKTNVLYPNNETVAHF